MSPPIQNTNDKAGWGKKKDRGENLALDLPTSLSQIPAKEKLLHLRMISPNKDYHQAVYHTSHDVLKQQISHHLMEVNTKVGTLMDKAPSNNNKMKG